MKFKIFVYILLLGFIIYGMFIPVDTGLTDASLNPAPEDIAGSDIVADESDADDETDAADDEETVSESEEESAAEDVIDPDTLSEDERRVYDWSMTHENPDSILLTRDQIQDLNAETTENCSSVIDIMSLPSSMPTSTVLEYLENTYIPELPKYDNGTAITQEDLDAILKNMNTTGEIAEMALGIVTTRTDLRLLPTDTAFCTSADDLYYDQAQISSLYCAMPIWILHTSADGEWLYVQTYSSRGWVRTTDVAIASSADVWASYAAPEYSVVITDPQLNLDGTVVDMGCIFTCLEDTGTSFTIVLPVREEDGTLAAKEATVSYESAHSGYLDYTWTNFYTQLFKYEGFPYGWGDADNGVDAASLPGYIMRSFGIQLPRDLEAQAETFGSSLPLSEIADTDKLTALDALQLPALLYYGDKVSIYVGCMDGVYYEMYAPQATETVVYGEFTYWDRLTRAVVIN